MLLLMMTPAAAQDDTGADTQQIGNAGWITPDNPLWKAELTIEGLQEKITIDPNAKADLMLKHAEERLAEAQTTQDERAQERSLDRYRKQVNKITNSSANYEKMEQVRDRIMQHGDAIYKMAQNNTAFENTGDFVNKIHSEIAEVNRKNRDQMMGWWNLITERYNIPDAKTPVSDIPNTNYDEQKIQMAKSILPNGTTQVYITNLDGSTIYELVVYNEDTVYVQKGNVANPDAVKTISISKIKALQDKYGGLLNNAAG